MIVNGKVDRYRNEFIGMIFTQVFATSFFTLQWMGVYVYLVIPQNNAKSDEQWAIDLFVVSLTNDLYYMINVKSFYLSTLTSRYISRPVFLPPHLRPPNNLKLPHPSHLNYQQYLHFCLTAHYTHRGTCHIPKMLASLVYLYVTYLF